MGNMNWQRTRDILICVICIGLILWASWSILGIFVETIVILLLSMAIAFLMTPAVNLLVKYGLPRILAALITYIVVMAVLVWISYEVVASLVLQAITFSQTIANVADSLPQTFSSTIDFLENQAHIPPQNINNAIGQIQQPALAFASSMATNSLNIASAVVNAFVNILLVAVISFYLTLDGKRIRDSLVSIAPKRFLPNALLFEDALSRVVGNYIRGQLTLALLVGVATGLICVVNGLGDYALICGALAFVFETIPMIGPVLASITPILLSLLLGGPGILQRTLLIIICFIVLQVIESNILGPRIVGHAVGLHPVASILALLVGAKLFGIFGALLATPIVAASWVVITSLYRSARGESADEIMARKRAPWLRRPTTRINLRRKRPGEPGNATFVIDADNGLHGDENEPPIVDSAAQPVDDDSKVEVTDLFVSAEPSEEKS